MTWCSNMLLGYSHVVQRIADSFTNSFPWSFRADIQFHKEIQQLELIFLYRICPQPFCKVVNTDDYLLKPINLWDIMYINTYLPNYLAFDKDAMKLRRYFLNFSLFLKLIVFLDKSFNLTFDFMSENSFRNFLFSCIPSTLWSHRFCLRCFTKSMKKSTLMWQRFFAKFLLGTYRLTPRES